MRLCGIEAEFPRHDVHHDGILLAVPVPHGDLFLPVEAGIPLVSIQSHFAGRGDLPQQAVDLLALGGDNGCHAEVSGAAPKGQPVVVQRHRADRRRCRAADGHLFQVDIAAVGEIQLSVHQPSSNISSASTSDNRSSNALARTSKLPPGRGQGMSVSRTNLSRMQRRKLSAFGNSSLRKFFSRRSSMISEGAPSNTSSSNMIFTLLFTVLPGSFSCFY
ncbi:hypothetical protein SDC9_122315 [bioreactor metagenome]|uniref:Uncharacterized protein n=1 Tax=bioreactor metagenome TaxID=1076179 RepID=A0A645CEJ7_9ZZZZ